MPKTISPAEKAPTMKYLMAASLARRSSRKKPVRTNELTLMSSMAIKITRKSVADTRKNKPTVAKRRSPAKVPQ
jgi:hypothetical protein